jgi:hypothetical protein
MRTTPLLTFAALLACAPALPAADVALADRFGWLGGHWCSDDGGERVEEYWLPAAGDIVLGTGRTVKAGKTMSFEFMRIETRGGVISYIALVEGQAATAFRLTASGADWARFENPEHDFPKRVEYRRTPAGLQAAIAGPDEGGKEQLIAFEYRRCDD